MFSTKSFCNISALASNVPGATSALGEITTYAKTFTKELGMYHSSTIEGYDLFNFTSVDTGIEVKMGHALVDQAIALVDYLVRTTLSTPGELFVDQLLIGINPVALANTASSVALGPMVSEGVNWLPSWISWSDDSNPSENTHKVWLAIGAFQLQYTEYEIVVVPPFARLDDFFLPGSIVESRIKAITPTQMMEQIEVVKGGDPETRIRTDPYAYHDTINPTRIIDVYWTVLIYGDAGDNPDLIRDALASFILANSAYDRVVWAKVFPDIFKRTEFIFVPYWENYAAGQRILSHGVYSPVVNIAGATSRYSSFVTEYAAGHIANKIQVMGFPYRSLVLAVVGNIENRNAKHRLTDYYPDYMNVSTSSTDFNRMSLETQTLMLRLNELIVLAERWDESVDVPHGTSRVMRGGKMFLVITLDRVQYLVLTKKYVDLAPPAA